ncbi:uncharacterized protein LOC128709957 [Anopheles marshallii]|uniref:uncharacterized protein LOC128709957 n=1 Tax=Anopheles marshallii TaxID=1521116 RepID=UPI00237C1B86|nr:uncharacterized protein LOC128709957 [Anopheles marshallii]
MTSSISAGVAVPEWMTKEYFVDAIAVKLDLPENAFTITDLDVRKATEAGDNYASILYRVRVSVRVHDGNHETDVSLIVKALPNLGLSDEMIKMMNLFPKEMAMYTDILPAMERLYDERGRTGVSFGPRCLKHSTEPTDVIVMEDLHERQFTMANRHQGMDMEHTRLALRRMAQFHAASVVLQQQRGPYGELFKQGLVSDKARAMTEQFHKQQAEFFQMILRGWSDKTAIYADLMKHCGMDLFDSLLLITRANPAGFNVLNHGDMWCNNILFRHKAENEPNDIVLIDYQLSFWSSPAHDLLYFILTSVNGDLKLSQMNYMIQYYHEHLVDSFNFLGYNGKVPLLKELHSDITTHHLFGLMISLSILPACVMEKTDDASMDLMLDQGDAGVAFKLKMYNNPVYVKQMGQILDFFYDRGVFDLLQIGTQRAARIECDPSLELPLWLDQEFIEHIVDSKFGIDEKNKRIVRSVYVKNAAKKGDSYASALYSAKVSLLWKDADTEETLSLIIKAPPKGIAASYTLDKDMYVRELHLYQHLIPAFEALYHSKGVSVKLGPRHYTTRVGLPVDVIVLEDLTISGFRMANRQEGLDKAHVEAVLDHLALFHAASAVYCESGNTLPKELAESSSDREMASKTDAMFAPSLDSLFKYMREWEFAAEFVDDLETVSRQIYTLLVDTWTIDVNGFNVLNHGDAWLNNILFSYDDETVKRVAMVDYQFPSWGSPVFDLIHFLFSSVRGDLKLSKQAYFLRYYQERLVHNLVLLGYRKRLPTLQQLHIDFNDRLSAAIKTTVIDLPYVLADPSEDASQEAAIVQTEAGQRFQKLLFDNDRFKQHMKELLPYFRSRGLLTPLAANCRQDQKNFDEFIPKQTTFANIINQTNKREREITMTSSISAGVAVPQWMTKEYFVDAIAVKLDLPENAFTITDLDVRKATEAGDNYASILYRVRVSVRVHDGNHETDVSLIVKALPNLGLSDEMIKMMNLFPKEMAMYTDILPAMERLYDERGRTGVSFGPRCLKHSTEPTDVIVMEDLHERQFTMANRHQGMDMEHTRLALRRMAQFHAASVVLQQQRGPYGELFKQGLVSDKARAMTEQFHKQQAEFFQMILRGWSDKTAIYADLMKHCGMDLFDSLLLITRANPAGFNVLNHGDMWCNNILFRHKAENEPNDIVLIDYQLSFWSSPAHDLLYFILTSVNGDLKLSQMNYMIQYYHEHLVDSFNFLGYNGKVPLLKELHSDITTHHLFGLMISLSILPACVMEKTDDASMDLMLDQGDAGVAFKLKMYNNPVYVKQMGQILDFFYDRGVFDLLQIGTQRAARIECDPSLELPLWLDQEFIEHIVDSKFGIDEKNKRIVRSVYVKNAAKKGDSYASALYSAKVSLLWKDADTEETLSLIIKAPPKGIAASYTLDKDMYVRELHLYQHLIPAFEALYHSKGVSVKLGPRHYTTRVGLPVDVIVLEDLTISGFRMANRQEGLDKAHVEAVLDHLALFHAASAVYCESGNTLPKELAESSSDREMASKTDAMFAPSLDSLFKYMREWEFAEEFVDDLETVSRQIYTLLVDTWTIDVNGFNVLNHGDAWLNNILFSYDDETVKRVAMVDYQFPSWGSPVFDLIHFLFSSVRGDLKLSKQAYFLRYYQERLVHNLVLLGYRKRLPTLQQLHIDFNDRLSAAIKTTVIDLPYVLADPSEDASQEAAIVQTEAGQRFQKLLFDNDRFKQHMKELLPYFRSRGLLTPLAANCRQDQ